MFKRYPAWRWWGRNRHGLKLRGIAFNPPQMLRLSLWQQGIQLQRTQHVRHPPLTGKRLADWQLQFTKSWVSLLQAGLPQLDALNLLQQQAQHHQAERWLHEIQQALHAGTPLHMSLAQSNAGFSRQYCRLIEVGESSGQLTTVLTRLLKQKEQAMAQARAMRKALTYPLIVFVVALLVVVAMMYLVVPQFVAMYQQMNVDVPASTERLLLISAALREPTSWVLLALPIGILLLLRACWPTILRRPTLIAWIYALPLFGSMLRQQHLLHDVATLQLAYASSIPLTDACELTARSSLSGIFRRQWQSCQRLLASGASLHEILQQNPYFDREAIQRIRLGEESGRLSEQLEQLIEVWQSALDDSQQRLLKAVEPLFLLLTGCITGAILLALYIPLFQLGQLVG